MIPTDIVYSELDEQIKKLKDMNLIIVNEETAKTQLKIFGYSNLIKGYREPYIITNATGEKVFKEGTSFMKILSLHQLDKTIRSALLQALLSLEEHIKEQLATLLAKTYGVHQDDYLNITNFKNKKKKNSKYSLSATLDKIKDALNSDRGAIPYYRAHHNCIPPWVLFKNIYFSTTVSLIGFLKNDLQTDLAKALLFKPKSDTTDEQLRIFMRDLLNICNEFRNVAAHDGIIYNYESSGLLREKEIIGSGEEYKHVNLSGLIVLMHLFIYITPFKALKQGVEVAINTHLNMFPEDAQLVGDLLDFDLIKLTKSLDEE